MAEDHIKRSASFGGIRRDDSSFEEDPLIELARIVAEDGGFRRGPELRPARNEPARHDSPMRDQAIANQLEAELTQNWEAEAQPPAPRFPEIVIEDARPRRQDATEPFEEELNALFPAAEASRPTEAAHGPAEEAAAATSLPEYQESYGDSYSAEIHDFEAVGESDAEPDDFYAEEDATALAADRREPARRSYKGPIAAVGVLGVVIVGGAVAAIVGGVGSESDSGPPPVIRAEAGPAKVEPEATAEAQAGDGAGQAVYDRVAGRAPKSDEQLVERAEQPQQVSRVVLPGADAASQADEAAGAGAAGADERPGGAAADSRPDGASAQERIAGQISSETPGMLNGPRIDPVGPRRVRTVTVRPDGSIASTPAPVRVAETASQPLGQVEADFSGADAPDPVPVRTVKIEGDGQGPSRALQSEPAASQAQSGAAPQPFAPALDSRRPQAAAPDGNGGASEAAAEEAAEPASPAEEQVAMLPRARPDEVPAAFLSPAAAQGPEPQQAANPPPASARGGQPVDLLAAGPAAPRPQAQQPQPSQQAARPASPSGSSPYAVQLSAQRSEDQARATFASLRNRYPSILGSQQPQIERADLGERGIYYRVRVGAGSQAEANQLCERLKAAGGSCFVAR